MNEEIDQKSMKKNIVIVGGGITGLSAAWYLQQLLPDARLHLVESEPYWGGKVISETIPLPEGDLVIEGGPESFVTRKTEMVELARDLGLVDSLVSAPSQASKMRILSGGRPMPAPMSPAAFVTTPLLSTRGKLRMMAEPFMPARRDDEDESLADFVDRRLGREAREKFVGPVLAGIYNTNPETQSILATSPVMRDLEKYGSLVLGAMARMRQRSRVPKAQRLPSFVTFGRGTQVLAKELVNRLRGDLRLGEQVKGIEAGWRVQLSSGEVLPADVLLLTVGANAAAALLGSIAPQTAGKLSRIRHNHIGTLSLVYRNSDLPVGLDVSGVMIPRLENRPIDALTCVKAPTNPRVPPGYTLVKIFFGGGQPHTVELEDAALEDLAKAELRALLGIEKEPIASRIYRWQNSFPQADVDHLALVDDIEKDLPPGIFLAGAAYRGIGVPDCIRQARNAAQAVVEYFK